MEEYCLGKSRQIVSLFRSPQSFLPFPLVAEEDVEGFESLFLKLTSVSVQSLLYDHLVHLVELCELLPV